MKGCQGIVGVGKRGTKTSNVELRRLQVTSQVVGLPFVNGGIEFDEDVASIHVLAVCDQNGVYDASLERLDKLAVAGRNDLPRCGGYNVDVAQTGPDKSQHKQSDNGCADRPADG